MQPPRLVCFDLGGVLVRICRSWAEGFRAAGLHVPPTLRPSDPLSTSGNAEWPSLVRGYQSGAIDFGAFVRRAARLLGEGVRAEDVIRAHRAWIRGPFPGTAEVLAALRERDIGTAVLSNTCAEHWVQLERLPFRAHVQYALASFRVGACKPDPEAFDAVERACGFAGDAILLFDDLAVNIDGARARGWRACAIDPSGDPAAQMQRALVACGALAST